MQILVTIPHFFPRTRAAESAKHGSQTATAEDRSHALTACIHALHQHFGQKQSMIL
jgi:hypothetical protein